jgi:hypothetical protein
VEEMKIKQKYYAEIDKYGKVAVFSNDLCIGKNKRLVIYYRNVCRFDGPYNEVWEVEIKKIKKIS